MEIDAIRNYLKLLMSAVAENTSGAEIQETEDGPVLLCTAESPFGGREDIGYRFEITPLEDGLLVLDVAMFVFGGVPADKLGELAPLISALNDRIELGSFRAFEDGETVMFVQGMVLDETLEASSVTLTLGKTLSIMENTVFNAGGYILRCIDGESADALIAEIERED